MKTKKRQITLHLEQMLEGFGLVNKVRKGFLQKGKQGQNLLLCRGHSMGG